jgi:hypothetical protein
MKIHYPFGQPPEGVDVLYRCEAKRYSVVIDADADLYGVSAPRLEVTWWQVEHRTPKGAWAAGRFVLLTAYKKWAAETEAEAIRDFVARKRKQIRILAAQLQSAERELALTQPKNHELLIA